MFAKLQMSSIIIIQKTLNYDQIINNINVQKAETIFVHGSKQRVNCINTKLTNDIKRTNQNDIRRIGYLPKIGRPNNTVLAKIKK